MSYEYYFSKNSDYHTQINNKEIPYSACNMTSEAMGLIQAKYNPVIPEGWQLEDYLMSQVLDADETHILSYKPDAIAYAKEHAAWAFDTQGNITTPLNEVAIMLDWAANKVIGKEVSTFVSNTTVPEMLTKLFNGYGVVLSGVYHLTNGKIYYHITSLAGVVTAIPYSTDNISLIQSADIVSFIIDDPYGDYHTNYTDHHGSHIEMPYNDFITIQNTVNSLSKWAHFITPASS